MTLTPSDIEQKTFSTALRGYNLDEVDDFLDEVVRSMRKLQEDLDSARADLEKAGAEPDVPPPVVEVASPPEPMPMPAPVAPPPPPIDESALGKALIAAQETADRIVSDARSEADRILVAAKSEADSFEETRLQRKAEAEQEISMIDGLVDRVKGELVGLSTAVGGDLDAMSNALDQARLDLDSTTGLAGEDAEGNGQDDSVDPDEMGDDDAPTEGTVSMEGGGGDEDDDDEADEDDDDDDESGEEYFDFPDGEEEDEESGEATR